MKKILSLALAIVVCAACLVSCNQDNNQTKTDAKYTVGICQLVTHDALDAATKGFKDALKAEFGDDVTFIESNAQGDTAACTSIINDLVSKKVDLILANATPALQAAVNGTTEIPILGTSVTDYGTALSCELKDGVIGGNVSGASDLAPLDQQAQIILDILPNAKTVALLYCSAEANSAYQIKIVKEHLESKGLECKDFPFSDSNDVVSVSQAAAAAADVIYIPTDNTAASCIETINGAIGSTPCVTGEKGMCLGCGIATLAFEYYDLGVATGKMAVKVLKGEVKISEMKVEYPTEFEKLYNKTKCEELKLDTAAIEALGFKAIEN